MELDQCFEDAVFSPLCTFLFFLKKNLVWTYIWVFSLVPLMCLFLQQFHAVLITIALQYNLKSVMVIPPATHLLFRILSWVFNVSM